MAATIATLAQGEQSNDLSTLPRPSRAFCSAAAKYEEAAKAWAAAIAGYPRDVIPRALEHAGAPVKAMIGPWSHEEDVENFSGDIDLSPAAIDNHAMGTVFEELVRKFNEENN